MSQSPFVSYSQNREDVMLWRALRHIPQGFYIDVGANHPSDDSVTKAFYDRGWSGINVEPLPSHLHQLQAERHRDVNLGIAMGAQDGEIELFDTEIRGLATANSEVAEHHRASGLEVHSLRVPMRRLETIWKEYVHGPVHFLKIDVEGFEEQVLRGMDLRQQRPWILVIEATRPNSNQVDAPWDCLVTDSGYTLVYFDGLNRYYVAQEHAQLGAAFGSPPNVFDNYITAEQLRLQNELTSAHERLQQSNERIDQEQQRGAREKVLLASSQRQVARLQEHSTALLHQQTTLQAQLQAIYASHSWRVTAPLRRATDWLRRWRHTQATHGVPQTTPSAATAPLLQGAVRWHSHALPQQARIPLWPQPALPISSSLWWRIQGHVESHYSLAVVNRGLALALDAQSQGQVQWQAWHGQRYEAGNDIPAEQLPGVKAMLNRQLPAKVPVVSLTHHYPLLADSEPADLRLAMFFWEESRVPETMVVHLNAHTDAVLVSSHFVQGALRHSGYKHPIFIVPLGLAGYIHQTPARSTLERPKLGEAFRFLHVSSAFERKGVDVLLQAFFEHFTATDQVELLIKTFANPHHDIQAQVNEWQQRYPHGPQVLVDLQPLDDAQMLQLYGQAHAVVLPSRGEGFGLPAAEAMALGIPLVTTGFGGQTDFAAHSSAYMVPYTLAASRSHVRSDGSYWAEPNCSDLALQMASVRDSVQAQDPRLEARCHAAAQWVRQNYRWELCAQAVQTVAAQMLTAQDAGALTPDTRDRLTVISPWNTACGIAEYSHALLEGWEQDFQMLVLCDRRTQAEPSQTLYKPCWSLGQSEDITEQLQQMLALPASQHPNVLLVQHQPSLFTLTDSVCSCLAALQAAGTTVILELHSTLPLTRERRLSPQAAEAISTLALVVIHKIEDANLALSLGWVNNVMLLPLGIKPMHSDSHTVSRASLGWSDDDIVLGCFGFLWAHKGVDCVIRSLKPLSQRSGKRVRLLAVTATPDDASKEVQAQYSKLASSLGVDQNVVWKTEFLPIQQSMELLNLADFQVFAYGPTSESASAAVTVGLATGRPVLVSEQPIFSDLADSTLRMEGNSADHITNAIVQLLEHPDQLQALQERQANWLQGRTWPVVSARLRACVHSLLSQQRLPAQPIVQMPLTPGPKQLLVDVSELVLRDAGTGIQRVVHCILREWLRQPPDGYVVRPVCAVQGHPYRYTGRFGISGEDCSETLDGQLVQAWAGDEFVGLDLSAHLFPQVEQQLHAWRLAGVRVSYVVYDIIPLTHPDRVVSALTPAFAVWVQGLYREADRLLCISQAVAHDVRRWMAAHAGTATLPEVTYFHLGAQLPVPYNASVDPTANALLKQLQDAPSFLMVGTIEPRKGYAQALDAMELLWQHNSAAHLVIVGKRGWMVEQLCTRLDQHPQLGRQLHWLEHADDATLQQLYRTCSALLAASEAEGFGLPLVEAAQLGLPIIARDIPVFQEIAQGHAFYFHAPHSAQLASALQDWLQLDAQGLAPQSAEMPWLTWHESAQQLWKAMR
jgi:FkbM family methyltransferase